jgi:phytoene synthase
MTPQEYCQNKAAKSGSSFYYAFLFLPPPRRAAITALYAFCREVDDVVDECSDPSLARIKLAWWQTEIQKLFDGAPSHPVTRALQPFVADFDLPQQHFSEIIEGMEMDLIQNRYLDFKALDSYCYRVAGAVGLLSARIFGMTDPATLRYAEKLGLALQLTNIIRDVGEDARKGRIYLPVNELQRFGVPAADILNGRYSPAFTELMQFQTARAQATYDEALSLLPKADHKAQRPGLMMGTIYRTLLTEIESENFQVLHQRITLTPLRKLWLAWRTWVRTR